MVLSFAERGIQDKTILLIWHRYADIYDQSHMNANYKKLTGSFLQKPSNYISEGTALLNEAQYFTDRGFVLPKLSRNIKMEVEYGTDLWGPREIHPGVR